MEKPKYEDVSYVRKIPFYSKVSYENVWVNAINDCRRLRIESPIKGFPDAIEALKMTLLQKEKLLINTYIETEWRREKEKIAEEFNKGRIDRGKHIIQVYTLLFEKIIEILEKAGYLLKTTTLMRGSED